MNTYRQFENALPLLLLYNNNTIRDENKYKTSFDGCMHFGNAIVGRGESKKA